jgi:hypothetical protein
MQSCECQIYCLPRISDPDAEVIPPPFRVRFKMALSERLSPRMKRILKRYLGQLSRLVGRNNRSAGAAGANCVTTGLKAGDLVRVRSKEEIRATLDIWGELDGCAFIPDMWLYCGTTQRVLKPVKRFLDEREYRFFETKGLVLLERAMCQGTKITGPCDRSCFFFWREEWLENIG